MSLASLEHIVKLAEQLSPDEQTILIDKLRLKRIQAHNSHPLREQLLREVDFLQNIPVSASGHLLGKYNNNTIVDMSAEDLHAELHQIATTWEEELDMINDES